MRLSGAAALAGVLDAWLLLCAALSQLWVSAFAGRFGYASLRASDATVTSIQTKLCLSAAFFAAAFAVMIAGSLWLFSTPRWGRTLITIGLGAAVVCVSYQVTITGAHVSLWWTVSVLGLATMSTLLAWSAVDCRENMAP